MEQADRKQMKPKTLLEMAGVTLAPPPLSESTVVVIDAQREYTDGKLPLVNVEPALAEIGKLLKAQPDLKVYIVGHTDNVGAFDYNMSLSQRRAKSVVDQLIQSYGISADRLKPAGAGMIAPVASNDDEAGRGKNRRVEIVKQ